MKSAVTRHCCLFCQPYTYMVPNSEFKIPPRKSKRSTYNHNRFRIHTRIVFRIPEFVTSLKYDILYISLNSFLGRGLARPAYAFLDTAEDGSVYNVCAAKDKTLHEWSWLMEVLTPDRKRTIRFASFQLRDIFRIVFPCITSLVLWFHLYTFPVVFFLVNN